MFICGHFFDIDLFKFKQLFQILYFKLQINMEITYKNKDVKCDPNWKIPSSNIITIHGFEWKKINKEIQYCNYQKHLNKY